MRKLVTYTNGTISDFDCSEVIFIRNLKSETFKPGYERTREFPAEWSKFTPLRAGVLTVGHYVSIGGKTLQVANIELVP